MGVLLLVACAGHNSWNAGDGTNMGVLASKRTWGRTVWVLCRGQPCGVLQLRPAHNCTPPTCSRGGCGGCGFGRY